MGRIFSKTDHLVLWLVFLLIAGLTVFYAAYYLGYGQSVRSVSIYLNQKALRFAYTNLIETGSAHLEGYRSETYALTNAVVVNGTNYTTVVAINIQHVFGAGTLARTADDIFIWMENGKNPIIIPSTGYRARYFPPGF